MSSSVGNHIADTSNVENEGLIEDLLDVEMIDVEMNDTQYLEMDNAQKSDLEKDYTQKSDLEEDDAQKGDFEMDDTQMNLVADDARASSKSIDDAGPKTDDRSDEEVYLSSQFPDTPFREEPVGPNEERSEPVGSNEERSERGRSNEDSSTKKKTLKTRAKENEITEAELEKKCAKKEQKQLEKNQKRLERESKKPKTEQQKQPREPKKQEQPVKKELKRKNREEERERTKVESRTSGTSQMPSDFPDIISAEPIEKATPTLSRESSMNCLSTPSRKSSMNCSPTPSKNSSMKCSDVPCNELVARFSSPAPQRIRKLTSPSLQSRSFSAQNLSESRHTIGNLQLMLPAHRQNRTDLETVWQILGLRIAPYLRNIEIQAMCVAVPVMSEYQTNLMYAHMVNTIGDTVEERKKYLTKMQKRINKDIKTQDSTQDLNTQDSVPLDSQVLNTQESQVFSTQESQLSVQESQLFTSQLSTQDSLNMPWSKLCSTQDAFPDRQDPQNGSELIQDTFPIDDPSRMVSVGECADLREFEGLRGLTENREIYWQMRKIHCAVCRKFFPRRKDLVRVNEAMRMCERCRDDWMTRAEAENQLKHVNGTKKDGVKLLIEIPGNLQLRWDYAGQLICKSIFGQVYQYLQHEGKYCFAQAKRWEHFAAVVVGRLFPDLDLSHWKFLFYTKQKEKTGEAAAEEAAAQECDSDDDMPTRPDTMQVGMHGSMRRRVRNSKPIPEYQVIRISNRIKDNDFRDHEYKYGGKTLRHSEKTDPYQVLASLKGKKRANDGFNFKLAQTEHVVRQSLWSHLQREYQSTILEQRYDDNLSLERNLFNIYRQWLVILRLLTDVDDLIQNNCLPAKFLNKATKIALLRLKQLDIQHKQALPPRVENKTRLSYLEQESFETKANRLYPITLDPGFKWTLYEEGRKDCDKISVGNAISLIFRDRPLVNEASLIPPPINFTFQDAQDIYERSDEDSSDDERSSARMGYICNGVNDGTVHNFSGTVPNFNGRSHDFRSHHSTPVDTALVDTTLADTTLVANDTGTLANHTANFGTSTLAKIGKTFAEQNFPEPKQPKSVLKLCHIINETLPIVQEELALPERAAPDENISEYVLSNRVCFAIARHLLDDATFMKVFAKQNRTVHIETSLVEVENEVYFRSLRGEDDEGGSYGGGANSWDNECDDDWWNWMGADGRVMHKRQREQDKKRIAHEKLLQATYESVQKKEDPTCRGIRYRRKHRLVLRPNASKEVIVVSESSQDSTDAECENSNESSNAEGECPREKSTDSEPAENYHDSQAESDSDSKAGTAEVSDADEEVDGPQQKKRKLRESMEDVNEFFDGDEDRKRILRVQTGEFHITERIEPTPAPKRNRKKELDADTLALTGRAETLALAGKAETLAVVAQARPLDEVVAVVPTEKNIDVNDSNDANVDEAMDERDEDENVSLQSLEHDFLANYVAELKEEEIAAQRVIAARRGGRISRRRHNYPLYGAAVEGTTLDAISVLRTLANVGGVKGSYAKRVCEAASALLTTTDPRVVDLLVLSIRAPFVSANTQVMKSKHCTSLVIQPAANSSGNNVSVPRAKELALYTPLIPSESNGQAEKLALQAGIFPQLDPSQNVTNVSWVRQIAILADPDVTPLHKLQHPKHKPENAKIKFTSGQYKGQAVVAIWNFDFAYCLEMSTRRKFQKECKPQFELILLLARHDKMFL